MKADADIAAILTSLESAAGKLGPLPVDAALRQSWQERLAAGKPALAENDFPLAAAATLLADVIEAQEGRRLPLLQAEELVADYLAERPGTDGWQEYGLAPERGDAFVHLACQTALARVAATVAETISLADWHTRSCPVCGAAPAFGLLDKDGGRLLVCGACLTSWRYKRLGCACCGEEQPGQLKVLTADEFLGWSVRVCLTCRGYLKTADLRQLAAAPCWQKAALDTLPLDFAATKWLGQETPGTL